MSSSIKWLVLKAATAIARSTSTLFYQLTYREMMREMYDLTQDGKKTVDLAYKIGYLAAEESAERSLPVFRLFPNTPEKIMDYFELLWELYNGMPMVDYTREWDTSDPEHPKLIFQMQRNELLLGLGNDPERDGLPWEEFWSDNNGYDAILMGLMTQVASFILTLKHQDKAFILKHTKSFLRDDNVFEIVCTLVPKEEGIYFDKDAPLIDLTKMDTTSESFAEKQEEMAQKDDIWSKITDKITIDQLEELFSTPQGQFQTLIKKISNDVLHMPPYDLIDHFTNYEEELIKIVGFILFHLPNELGQLPEKMFENEQVAKVYGHIFKFMQKNAKKFLPVSVVGDMRDYTAQILDGLAPEEFINNFKNISPENILILFFAGCEKALRDLGIPFDSLKDTIYAEFQKDSNNEEEYSEEAKHERNNQIERLMEEAMVVSTALFSLPMQLFLIIAYNMTTGVSEMFSSAFNTLKESGQNIVDIIQEMRE